jgi:hypothetical protein
MESDSSANNGRANAELVSTAQDLVEASQTLDTVSQGLREFLKDMDDDTPSSQDREKTITTTTTQKKPNPFQKTTKKPNRKCTRPRIHRETAYRAAREVHEILCAVSGRKRSIAIQQMNKGQTQSCLKGTNL